MASIGCPLIDDDLYGGVLLANPGRQALHASQLAFQHPVTHLPMRFQAPLPEDLKALLVRFGLSYNET